MALCCCNLLKRIVISSNASSSAFATKRYIKRYVRPTAIVINNRRKDGIKLPIEKTRRSSFLDWNYNSEVYAFGKRLGEDFKIELLLQSFIHRSYIVKEELKQEQVGIDSPDLKLSDNNQLATEGRKVINDHVVKYLSVNLPRLPLEAIAILRNYLLSEKVMAHVSKNLGTTNIIMAADYPIEEATYAKTFHAIVGALARSQSLERTYRFVEDFVITQLAEQDIYEILNIKEPMKLLTDILARDGKEAPEPRIIGQTAMNEILATYTVGLYTNKEFIGSGPGETIETAVEIAAHDALRRLFQTTDSSAPLKFNRTLPDSPPQNLETSKWRLSAFE